MEKQTPRIKQLELAPRQTTRRVRLDLDVAAADKLKALSVATGRPQRELVELMLEKVHLPS